MMSRAVGRVRQVLDGQDRRGLLHAEEVALVVHGGDEVEILLRLRLDAAALSTPALETNTSKPPKVRTTWWIASATEALSVTLIARPIARPGRAS